MLLAETSELDEELSSKLSNFNNNYFSNQTAKYNNKPKLTYSNIIVNTSQNDIEPLNTSYRLVNEKVFKLKRLEFDYSNLCEVVKNYVIVQEIIVRHLFGDSQKSFNDMISKNDSFKSKVEVVDKLLFIVEDTLFYKAEEMEEDSIIIRKVIIRLLTNQKQFLLFGE